MKKRMLSLAVALAFMSGCGGSSGSDKDDEPKVDKNKVIAKYKSVCENVSGIFEDIKEELKAGGKARVLICTIGTVDRSTLEKVCKKLDSYYTSTSRAAICSEKPYDDYK